MNILRTPLNPDQLDGLANLLFDLAKGSFALIFLPISSVMQNPILSFVQSFFAMLTGLAFSYQALVLLKLKESRKI